MPTRWRREREVFLYFNNDWEGFAIQNALWMAKRVPLRTADGVVLVERLLPSSAEGTSLLGGVPVLLGLLDLAIELLLALLHLLELFLWFSFRHPSSSSAI